ncbi:MAG: VWA domain-containing protein, partial [Gammaproteobacteria bacterium]
MRLNYLNFCLAFLVSISLTHAAWAQNQLEDNINLRCVQSTNILTLQCDYHQTIPEPLLGISAKSGNTSLQIKEDLNYPRKGGITAILFVIDTSDPARQKVIEKNIAHIKIMLNSTKDYHRFGLVSFDKVLRNEAPIGSSNKQIIDAAEKLRAIGKTTELYRNMLKAIQLLRHIEADRKAIFLFSDGLAEDKAYYHQDVINAAQKYDVAITSIGYPRSVSQSVALQTLRRLSEETGGLFI